MIGESTPSFNFPCRVVKVGGSLLTDKNLPHRLLSYLRKQQEPGLLTLIVVGGGIWVDGVRHYDSIHGLSPEYCHWQSVRLMSESAQLLIELVPQLQKIRSIAKLDQQAVEDFESGSVVFDCSEFLEQDSRLPKTWQTTSDSIAARLAVSVSAQELVLLKSTLPNSTEIAKWKDEQFVDELLPTLASGIADVVVVDMSSDDLLSMKGN